MSVIESKNSENITFDKDIGIQSSTKLVKIELQLTPKMYSILCVALEELREDLDEQLEEGELEALEAVYNQIPEREDLGFTLDEM